LVKEIANTPTKSRRPQQELLIFGMDEPAAILAQGHSRNEEVDVGMMQHPAGPGLENGDETGLTPEILGVLAEVAEALRALAEQEAIEFAWMAQAGGAKLRGDGNGD
jgi:hypothetical protein